MNVGNNASYLVHNDLLWYAIKKFPYVSFHSRSHSLGIKQNCGETPATEMRRVRAGTRRLEAPAAW